MEFQLCKDTFAYRCAARLNYITSGRIVMEHCADSDQIRLAGSFSF